MNKTNLTTLRAHIVCSGDDSSLGVLPNDFCDQVLKAIDEITELRKTEQHMIKINWLDFKKQHPIKNNGFMRLCIVRIRYYITPFEWQEANSYDWFDEDKMKWQEHHNDEVTHWFYADEIPSPSSAEPSL